MMNQITLGILTKDRSKQLTNCLNSIANQTILPYEIIIIDNSKFQSAQKIIKLFSNLPIKYFSYKYSTIPQARNQIIKICKTDYLGFVDDDCLLDKNWVKEALFFIKNNHKFGYISGQNKLFNINNLFAQAQHYRQQYWFKYRYKQKIKQLDKFSLDSKNVILNLKLMRSKKIKFDNQIFINPIGDHADTDIGLQFHKHSLLGFYNSKMIVYHEDVNKFKKFIKKAYCRGRTGFLIYRKWKLTNELVFLPDYKIIKYIKRIKYWPVDFRKWLNIYHGNIFYKIIIFVLIKIYDWFYLKGFVDQAVQDKFQLNFLDKTDR